MSVTWTMHMDKDLPQTPLCWWLVAMPTAEMTAKTLPNGAQTKGAVWNSPHNISCRLSQTVAEGGKRLYFYNLSFKTSVLQESTSSHASHPNAARRAEGQLINSLHRRKEGSLVCRRNVFMWPGKGIGEGKVPPVDQLSTWGLVHCLLSAQLFELRHGKSCCWRVTSFPLQSGLRLTLLSIFPHFLSSAFLLYLLQTIHLGQFPVPGPYFS